ncbi:hypothetical protein TRVA0_001S04170 [Trichomonascus vanleenenianus]|uniref:uncharacterized protein n=1 Tax=Trichomonascus vanleenenianus TaxID=2268995 RepID=UPI003ECB572B
MVKRLGTHSRSASTALAQRPIFLATHPRSASTAFERSFMSREDIESIHEPFGEPFYYGPERLSDRYSKEECEASEYSNVTFGQILQSIRVAETGERRVFIKDMAQYLIPPTGEAELPHSLSSYRAKSNPTVLPDEELQNFTYVFLIRPPHKSIASYYTCCIPPQSEKTGFYNYRKDEAGYRELRILYEYLTQNDPSNADPLVVDAMDLCRDPEQVMARVCEYTHLPFHKAMLSWDDKDPNVIKKFAKWDGFHDNALKSTGFRIDRNASTDDDFKVDWEAWEKEWARQFDDKGVEIVRESVKDCLDDYLFLRSNKLQLEYPVGTAR